jgi:P4 family phage/plasmid primase-like protien
MSGFNKETNYNIFNFLQEHSVGNADRYTHTSMNGGKYYINDNDLEIFYKLYEHAFLNKKALHITEKTKDLDFGPIIIDLDFNYDNEIMERQHNIEIIDQIVKIYNEVLIETLNLEENDDRIRAFVFERKDIYHKNGIKKDGIHILYPKIITYPIVQEYIRECILKRIKPILKDMPLINKIHDVVDRNVIYRTGWLLFGSSKPGREPYHLEHIYDMNLNKFDVQEYDFEYSNLAEFFSIRNKKESQLIKIRDEKKEFIENKKVSGPKPIIRRRNVILDNLDEIKSLVSILNVERAENYSEWISIGWLLHNINPHSQELLDIWIEFSRKSAKFKDGMCEKEWNRSKNEGLQVPTLHFWAKIDNPIKYKEIIEKSLNRLIEISIKTPTHTDIAKVLFRLYEYEFRYSDQDWYKFKEHLWVKENDGYSLRMIISNELPKIYGKVITKYNKIITSVDANITEQERDEYKNKTKEIMNIIKQLKTVSFKENLMKESKDNFRDEDFHKKLNSNQHLLGFNNGIYDLNTCEFRDGRPDDYVQLTTDINKIEFEEVHENYEDLQYFFDTIFVDPDIRDYFLTYIASCLHGHNAEEKFRIWTGSGSNGKSKIIELILNSFGEYAIKFPSTLLTGKRAASNACTPEVVIGKGKRFGYFEEPDGIDNVKINAGLLKEYTGGDKVTGRALHKEPIAFKPQWKLALLCNDIPEIPPHDTGTWRRMEIVEFKSKFTRNPREPLEFKIDDQLSGKLKEWNEIFMAMLIDKYYFKYKKEGLKVPREVVKFTEEVQSNCDLYTEFVIDNLEQTNEVQDFLDMNELYDEFKIWYEDTFSNHKFPSKKDFKNYLVKKYNKKIVTAKGMKGFKFKGRDDSIKDTGSSFNLESGY